MNWPVPRVDGGRGGDRCRNGDDVSAVWALFPLDGRGVRVGRRGLSPSMTRSGVAGAGRVGVASEAGMRLRLGGRKPGVASLGTGVSVA